MWMPPTCASCGHEFQPGDRYIEDRSSGFIGKPEPNDAVDDIMADIFGGSDGKIMLCEGCTMPGGHYRPKTFSG
jgi:hypothetical protein